MIKPACWPIESHELQMRPIAGMAELELWGKVAMTDREHSYAGPQSYADYLSALADVYHQPEPNENLMFGLWRKKDIVGLFMLSRSGDPSAARVTYEIAPGYRKRGYATAALGALVAHGSAELGFEDFTAEINAYNTASQKVAKRVGFTVVGMSGASLELKYHAPHAKR